MVDSPPGQMGSLTGLRAVAAFTVFWYHMQWMAPGLRSGDAMFVADLLDRVALKGYIGVSFFFVLSGFVLTWSHRSNDRASSFWKRRAIRLYPTHAVTWLLAGILLTVGVGTTPPLLSALANLVLLPHVIFGGEWTVMNDPSWSIEVEAFFYLMFPLIIARISRFPARRLWRVAVVAVAICAGLALAVIASGNGQNEEYWRLLYFFPVLRLPEFIVGMALGLLARKGALIAVDTRLAWVAVAAAVAVDVVAPIPLTFAATTLVPFALLVSSYAVRDQADRSGRLAGPVWVHLGEISFAFYLCHYLVIQVVRHWFGDGPIGLNSAAGMTIASFGGALVAAEILHRVVEVPVARSLRRRLLVTPGVGP